MGPKVADCVALFSLDQSACIPVDTHVWRIARRDYDATLEDVASITPSVYERVGDLGSPRSWAAVRGSSSRPSSRKWRVPGGGEKKASKEARDPAGRCASRIEGGVVQCCASARKTLLRKATVA